MSITRGPRRLPVLERRLTRAALALASALLVSCSGGRAATSTVATSTVPVTLAPGGPDTAPTTTVAVASTRVAQSSSTRPSTAPSPTGQQATSSTDAPDGTVLVLDLLAGVVVENEQGSGYQRSLFAHWVDLDGDGCDTRAEVLTRDSSSLVQRDPYRCRVVEGDWYSVYDGWEETLPSEIDIDHVVALKEAWDSGAWDWSPTARRLFANDVTDSRTLRAVSDDSNRAKSDKDPSNWLPMSSFVCTYLGDWVSIKVRWNLSMDQSEFGRVRNLLTSECPGLRVPAPTAPPVDVPPAGSGGAVDSVPSNDAGVGGGDVYFANCAAARAAGAAPLREGEPGYRTGLDRDRDGVACEG